MKTSLDNIINSELFDKYYEYLVSENEKYNLTSITKVNEVYVKHFFDSVQVENVIDLSKDITLCDVGSGAGFPSIPLKIIYPNIKLTIIEPTGKRCTFLKSLVELLELKDVTIINDRAENIKDVKFDVVCARAVSNMPILLELCIPLTKTNGYFIALKGSNYQEELDISKHALKELSSKVEDIYTYELKDENDNYGIHSLIKVLKEKETKNIYPRNYAQIKKKPL